MFEVFFLLSCAILYLSILKDVYSLKKTKILHLLSSNNFTNIENSICQSIDLLKDVFDIAYVSPNGPISKVLRSKEINYLPLDNFDLKSINSVLGTYNPDIIHAHDLEACLLASKFSKQAKIVAQLHQDYEILSTFSLKSLSFKNAAKNFNKLVWPSEASKNSYKYVKDVNDKSSIYSPSVDCEKTIAKSNNENIENNVIFDMIMFADELNIEEIKNVINILALLQGRGFTFKFGAISSNPFNEEITQYLKETGVEDSFVWINKTNNYYNILSKAKILFISKVYEETPIYALEASALGIPILSVFSNGLKNIIQNEFNGFLANNEYDLANFAARMLDDRHLWLLLSTNALTNADNQNNIEKYKNDLLNLYK